MSRRSCSLFPQAADRKRVKDAVDNWYDGDIIRYSQQAHCSDATVRTFLAGQKKMLPSTIRRVLSVLPEPTQLVANGKVEDLEEEPITPPAPGAFPDLETILGRAPSVDLLPEEDLKIFTLIATGEKLTAEETIQIIESGVGTTAQRGRGLRLLDALRYTENGLEDVFTWLAQIETRVHHHRDTLRKALADE